MTNELVRENNGQATARRENERFVTPPASVSETADGYLLDLEMPGVGKDGLEISIENNELSIVGRKNAATPDGTVLHRESRPHPFRRAFELDPSIDPAKISPRRRQGVIPPTLPTPAEVHPRPLPDFEDFCPTPGVRIRERIVMQGDRHIRFAPNLRGSVAVYRFEKA